MNERKMNEPDETDEMVELLSSLSRLEPSLPGRIENRRVVAAELARLSRQHQCSEPWWRRSISIPWPLAIAASLLLMYGATLIKGRSSPSNDHALQIANDPELLRPPASDSAKETEREQSQTERPSFEIQQTYVCGVGRISTHSFYHIEEH